MLATHHAACRRQSEKKSSCCSTARICEVIMPFAAHFAACKGKDTRRHMASRRPGSNVGIRILLLLLRGAKLCGPNCCRTRQSRPIRPGGSKMAKVAHRPRRTALLVAGRLIRPSAAPRKHVQRNLRKLLFAASHEFNMRSGTGCPSRAHLT